MAVLLSSFSFLSDFREVGLGLNYLTFIMFGLVKINILNVCYVWACQDLLEFIKIGSRKSIYKHWLVSSGNPGGRLNQFTEFIVVADSISTLVVFLASLTTIFPFLLAGKPSFTKKQADLFFPPDFADDFPVAMQVSKSLILVTCISKQQHNCYS